MPLKEKEGGGEKEKPDNLSHKKSNDVEELNKGDFQ